MAKKKAAPKPVAIAPPPYEDKWRAREDAHTLASADEIRRDRARHSAAKKHVQSMVRAVMPSGRRKGK